MEPFARKHGFRRKGRALSYFHTQNDVRLVIDFQYKSTGYSPCLYLHLLYLPEHTDSLEFGNDLACIHPHHLFDLSPEMPDDVFETRLRIIIQKLDQTIDTYVRDLCSPAGVARHILNSIRYRHFFQAQPHWRLQAAAYSELMLGNLRRAEHHLVRFIKLCSSDALQLGSVISASRNAERMVELIHDDPAGVPLVLQEIIAGSQQYAANVAGSGALD